MKLALTRRILVTLITTLSMISVCRAETGPTPSSSGQHDIVLVLDNSASMRFNDRNFATKHAATQFIKNTTPNANVGVIIFDDAIRAAVHLGPTTVTGQETLISGIEQMNHQGHLTNIPLALTEAVKELKTHAREQADRSVVLLTDGVVDTGDKNRNREGRAALIQDLIPDASTNKIRIFTIALGQKSDMDLLQSLANRTHGTYFWAASGGDVKTLFEQIQTTITQNDIPSTPITAASATSVADADTVPTAGTGSSATEQVPNLDSAPASSTPKATQETVVAQTAATEKTSRKHLRLRKQINKTDVPPITTLAETSNSKDTGHPWWFNALGVLILALMSSLLYLLARARRNPLAASERVSSNLGMKKTPLPPQAVLYDLTGVTGCQRHEIDSGTIIIGRVPPAPHEQIGCIVIDRQTIGRRHAVIERKHYGFWLIDQHSKNGTYINDQRVTGETCLSHGDRIRFHEYDFEFNLAGMGLADDTVPISDFVAQNLRKVGNMK